MMAFYACSSDADNATAETISGSYANMLAIGDFLYFVTNEEIVTYSIEDRTQPNEIHRQFVNAGVESLFHNSGKLYVGSETAMIIYLIDVNGIPQFQSRTFYNEFLDLEGCDPIVTNDSIAYVTVSASLEGACRAFNQVNDLILYDVSDFGQPTFISRVNMIEPKGLALDGNYLFVCENDAGLKVFDVSDPFNVTEIHHFSGFNAYDVISLDGLLLVAGNDDIYQYDYSDIGDMKLISQINI